MRKVQPVVVLGRLGVLLTTPAGAEAQGAGQDTGRDISRDTLAAVVGWTPTLHQKIDSAGKADREVARGAGAGRIR
ncbi:hypothetical protein [Streptomyces sp. 11x1]|uniref:hypothetical protein n=1 Tax=Streptomyces sp. 11x1 TaxID=3038642 RepID=UPI00292E52AB|nr:hypothetical protein [Streptomyces sp. 11x1]WNZ12549.1 hypothetical protein P8T65_36615 [Streptomyces sp. 11x1]